MLKRYAVPNKQLVVRRKRKVKRGKINGWPGAPYNRYLPLTKGPEHENASAEEAFESCSPKYVLPLRKCECHSLNGGVNIPPDILAIHAKKVCPIHGSFFDSCVLQPF
jgi:hypothetical protein